MQRTQIYLTNEERSSLNTITKQTGKSQSQLIREAVDYFISQFRPINRKASLQQAKGLWAKRQDLPDFKKIRKELDRKLSSREK